MREFVIFTDSCCDLPEDLVKSFGLTVIPLTIQFGQEQFQNKPGDGPDIHTFYTRLAQGELAKTSAPNVEAFKEAIRPILAAGKDVLYLAFSSALSATYQTGTLALEELREEFPKAVLLASDTLCASLGQGLLVDLALREQKKGKSVQEVHAFVEETKGKLCHWFTVDDLGQLRRGGRLSAGKAVAGALLNIKPVLHVDDQGRLVPVDTVRGRKKSISALLEHMKDTVIDPESQHVYISHGDCLEEAEALAQMVKETCHVPEVTIGYVGPVIGAHSGKGTLALFFLGSKR